MVRSRAHPISLSLFYPNQSKVGNNTLSLVRPSQLVRTYQNNYSPNHSKNKPFKIRTFLSGFPMVLTKWGPFVRISNGRASGFQMPFEIQTICNPTCFGPLEMQTRLDFRSPLYCSFFEWHLKTGPF